MEEDEFDVLDELYFVISYDELKSQVELSDQRLVEVLNQLASKEWLRIYKTQDEELDEFDLNLNYGSYFYLASKKGLFAHNQQ